MISLKVKISLLKVKIPLAIPFSPNVQEADAHNIDGKNRF